MTPRSLARHAAALALVPLLPALISAQERSADPASNAGHTDTATVVVTRPTVIAYLVIPSGAVDTSADLAVLADDWNVAMATVGDSLASHGVGFALVTESRLRVRMTGRRDVVLALDDSTAAGYVFARPGSAPCVRRRPAELDDVMRAGRMLATREMTSDARTRANCTLAQ